MIDKITNHILIKKLKEVLSQKNYAFFESGNYNLNIIGIRSDTKIANIFDDIIFCIYKEDNNWVLKKWEATTDAGTYWLKNPMNKKGTALLVPNQYKGVYGIRKHNGKYDALCQTWGDVQVYRDNNKNNILDYNKETIVSGKFGINIHKSNPYNYSKFVEKYSAGCQVFKKVKDFNDFMTICNKSKNIYGNKFTYTLLSINEVT
tara:strand:- start:5825 stop:6436 length:612 start_codon:yes stop_codon:yes gene_type:complete